MIYVYLLLFLAPFMVVQSKISTNLSCTSPYPNFGSPIYPLDVALIQFALNLEFLETEWFLFAAYGKGLDAFEPEFAMGGPPPIGGEKANLDQITQKIAEEFGLQEVGHLRAIITTLGGFPRPQIDLSKENFAKIFDAAFGYTLIPPFNPYLNSLHFLLASYLLPYVGLTGYAGANQYIGGYVSKRLLAGLLGVESGQDAVIRAILYERAAEIVSPYNKHTVAEFTDRLSILRNELGKCGIKDEGLVVPPELGAEGKISSNVLSADRNSLAYRRTPQEILRIVYGSGDEHRPGGFFPKGGNGEIARSFLE